MATVPYPYTAMANFMQGNQRVVGDTGAEDSVHQISTANADVKKLILSLCAIGDARRARPTILNTETWEADGFFVIPAELASSLIRELTEAGKIFDAKYGSQ